MKFNMPCGASGHLMPRKDFNPGAESCTVQNLERGAGVGQAASKGLGLATLASSSSTPSCPGVSCCALPVGSYVHPGKFLCEAVGSALAFKHHWGLLVIVSSDHHFLCLTAFQMIRISWRGNVTVELEPSHCEQVLEENLLPCYPLGAEKTYSDSFPPTLKRDFV